MKKFLILALVLCASLAMAEKQNVLTQDFETYTVGDINGQDGWEKLAWWVPGNANVVNDPVAAQSGSQYVQTTKDANELWAFDISESYSEGVKYIVGAWGLCPSDSEQDAVSVRFQCNGTSGKTYDVEIAECNVSKEGHVSIWVNGTSFGADGNVNDWNYFGVQIDPATKAVEKIFINDQVKDCENAFYKSSETEGCGSLPDSLRIYKLGALDNFTIDAIPEPAFLGLLALAGLLFARKN